MKTKLILPLLVLLTGVSFFGTSCTENIRARNFGGTLTIKLPKGSKLVNATWKEGNDLWYLIRPMRADEKPEQLDFIESSSLGVMNGKVIFIEEK